MDKVPLLLFVGAAGAGKTTAIRRLLQLHPTWSYEEVYQLLLQSATLKTRLSTVDGTTCELTNEYWDRLALIWSRTQHVTRPYLVYVDGAQDKGVDWAVSQLNMAEVWWRRLGRWLRLPVFSAPPEATKLLQLYVKSDTVLVNHHFDTSFEVLDNQIFEVLLGLGIETPWTIQYKEGLRW